MCVQSHVATFENESCESFRAVAYCKLSGIGSYDDQCTAFINEFSSQTQTNFVNYRSEGARIKSGTCLEKPFLAISLKRRKQAKREGLWIGNIRDKDCKARTDFKKKIVNRNTCRNDHNLKTGLDCVVHVVFDHSHPVTAADAMSLVYQRDHRIVSFIFSDGVVAGRCETIHEIFLTESAADDD